MSPIFKLCLSKLGTVDHALCGCKRSKRICENIFSLVDGTIMDSWLQIILQIALYGWLIIYIMRSLKEHV